MSGHYVHIPPKLHQCDHPECWDAVGTMWRCEGCGAYWRFGHTDGSWGPVWHQPFWANMIPRSWAEWRYGK